MNYNNVFSHYDWYNEHTMVVASPGRINIIGEHTDYNDGFVLPAAVDKAVYIALRNRDDDQISLHAHDFSQHYSTAIADIKPVPDGHWANYILGTVAQILEAGHRIKGFNAVMLSDVPIGAGMSSSAAVECATAFAINEANALGIAKMDMVKMAQMAEHEFVGVKCGIMDMFASMMGKKDHCMQLDCRSLEYKHVPLQLDGYKLLLLNTNVKHSLASSAYNQRRSECEMAVAMVAQHEPSISALRDVSVAMLDKYVMDEQPIAYKRAKYVVEEIARLQAATDNLAKGDLATLGELMLETHEGLSKSYEVSCKELDWLVNAVKNNPSVLGARMMGGGFGGCTINIVAEDAVDKLMDELSPKYSEAMQLPLSHYIVTTGDGTHIVK